ncbi:hypothetical protein D3C75_583020 [compost metagenome]
MLLLVKNRQPEQHIIQITAGFPCFYHVDKNGVEHGGITGNRLGELVAPLHIIGNIGQNNTEFFAFRLFGQGPHRIYNINPHLVQTGQLPAKDGEMLGLDPGSGAQPDFLVENALAHILQLGNTQALGP